MKITQNIEIVDLALYFGFTLVIADLHIGYEEALNRQGFLVPRTQFEEIVKRIENIFNILKGKKLKSIVINGDLKQEFGMISEQEWRNALKFLDLLAKHCDEVILVKGNHDTMLKPIANKRNVKVLDYLIIDSMEKHNNKKIPILKKMLKNTQKSKNQKILIIHGDKIPSKELMKGISTIVIGHEHPAVSIKEGARIEQFKCFLKGKYNGKTLIVQPSFNTLIEGTNILRDNIHSPFLKHDLDNFEVFAVEDKVYDFGKLKKLR